jgi:uncharacterized membrane protein
MIDVRVRDHDGLHREPMPLHDLQNLGDIVSGIDNDSLARLFVAEDRAVALQHADRQDLVNHIPNCILVGMTDALNVIMRWMHITSVVVLIGGVLYARFVIAPALASLPSQQQDTLSDAMAARYRSLLYLAVLLLTCTGIYNLFMNLGRGPLYQSLLGIKMLLVLHVFAVGILIVKPKNPKRTRQMTGLVISGLTIIAISAVLRQLHQYYITLQPPLH